MKPKRRSANHFTIEPVHLILPARYRFGMGGTMLALVQGSLLESGAR
jgi:hypothetical protein